MDLEKLVTIYVNLLVLYQKELLNKYRNDLNIRFLEEEKNKAYEEFINKIYISSNEEINDLYIYINDIIHKLYDEINTTLMEHKKLYNEVIIKGNNEYRDSLDYVDYNLDDCINKLKKYENIIYGIKGITKLNNKVYKK